MLHRGRVAGLFLVIGLILAGCSGGGGASASPTVATAHIDVAAYTRDYIVVTPQDVADRDPLPLLLLLHGWTQTVSDAESITGFDAMATDPGAVVVYPQGYEKSWNAGPCCRPANTKGVDDVAFISALIDKMGADYPIDAGRVFILGGSNGGEMAYRAACELSDRIAAAANVIGTLLVDCEPTTPVSVIDIHGTADTVIGYEGGGDCQQTACPSVAQTMERWRQIDGCTGDPAETNTGLTVEDTWTDCDGGTTVTFIKAIGGGHSWYSTEPDDQAVTWAFFMNHPRTP